jgi:hypothetical protein
MNMTNEEVLNATKHLIGTRYVHAVKGYIGELVSRTVEGSLGIDSSPPFHPNHPDTSVPSIWVVVDDLGIIHGFRFF